MLVVLVLRMLGVMFVLGALHLNYNTYDRKLRQEIFTVLSWIYLMDCAFLLLVWFLLGSQYFYLDWNIPLNQAYGPLVYFLYLESSKGKISRKTRIIHAIPVVIVWIAYIVYISSPSSRAYTSVYFTPLLYVCISSSMLGYSIYIMSNTSKNTGVRSQVIFMSWYLFVAGLAALFLTYQMLVEGVGGGVGMQMDKDAILTALFMLGGAIILFGEAFSDFRRQFIPKLMVMRSGGHIEQDRKPVSGQVSNFSFSKDRRKVEEFFQSEWITDPDLEIKKASEELGMPQKGLTDRLQEYYGDSFPKVLAAKRIDLACRLLMSEVFFDYNDLAFRCGFSSKATFYRNFQKLKGCSPTQYKTQK